MLIRTIPLTLAAATLFACGRALQRPENGSASITEAAVAALEFVPFDSLCSSKVRCRAISIDPRIRRVPGAAPYDPYSFEIVARLGAANLSDVTRPVILAERARDKSQQPDTLAVTIAVVVNTTQSVDTMTVLIFMESAKTYGILASVRLIHSSKAWMPISRFIQEG